MNFKSLIFTLLVLLGAPLGFAQEATTASGTIGSRDSVEIRVFREDDLTTRGQLSGAGTVSIPLIGDVRLAGMTTDSAAQLIERKLRDGYLVRPEVTVAITSRVRKTVTVLGKVQSPGVFRLDPNRQLTLAEAIGMAGGLQRIGNSRKVTLKRRNSSTPMVINFKDIASGRIKDIPLSDGDIINIPESLF
ncbi:polysaccharide biosynthesis/export family protein [Haloferula sp.]|uniref:polysaccharide biosynthesis/export family protein n=1 Tax=Haloferula sp. TaxID=2497595 RepID=UPI00329ECFC1